jgi:hypothetical protein
MSKYAILQETSGEEFESWLYFIKIEGNEEALQHLQVQLQQVEWYILDENSTFDLELTNPVSETTAKEMTRVDLNHFAPHRKFDGKMEKINLGLKEKSSNNRKIIRVNKILSYGGIEAFIEDEDMNTDQEGSEDEENELIESKIEKGEDESSEEEDEESVQKNGTLPSTLN